MLTMEGNQDSEEVELEWEENPAVAAVEYLGLSPVMVTQKYPWHIQLI